MSAQDAIRAGQLADERGDLAAAASAFAGLLDDKDPAVVAVARLNLGRVSWKQGRFDDALTHCREARAIAIRLGDAMLRGQIENAIGVVHVARGEYEQARAAYAVALEQSDDVSTRAKIALNLGVIANVQGDHAGAAAHYRKSLDLFGEAGDERGSALALHNLGMLRADRREWDEADEAFRSALALFEKFQNRQMIANVLVNASEVSFGRSRPQEGIAQCDMALRIFAELGDEVGRGEALRWRGHGLRVITRLPEAESALDEAVRIAERAGVRLLEAEARHELGLVLKARGRADEARAALRDAIALYDTLGATSEAGAARAALEAS